MDTLKELTSLKPPYMHLLVGPAQKVHDLLSFFKIKESKSTVTVINGSHCSTADDFFKESATALSFPNYFGHTWDSFDECLNDLNWLPASGSIIIIKNFNEAFKHEPRDKKILIEILGKTARAWAAETSQGPLTRKPTPFHIILHTSEHEKEIVRLLKQAGHIEFDMMS